MAHGSKRAVLAAIVGNTLVMIGKFVAFLFTGSAAMLSETLHSLADTTNQILLMVGIVRSTRKADRRYPFGYGAERHIWALMSAVGIFFLGAGVTVYHGINSLLHPHELKELNWAIGVLILSLFLEGYVLIVAVRAMHKEAGGKPFLAFLRHEADPTGTAVVLEDSAACVGILMALGGIVATYLTGQPMWDAIASIGIGVLLAGIAVWLIARNHDLLVGPAVPTEDQEKIRAILAANPVVERIVHLRTRMMDTFTYRVAVDVEFDGEKIAAKLEGPLKEAYEKIESYEDFRRFTVLYADQIVEQLGDEIDAIETAIKRDVPRARYLDIETE